MFNPSRSINEQIILLRMSQNFNIRLHADPVKFLQSKNPVRIFHRAECAKLTQISPACPNQAGKDLINRYIIFANLILPLRSLPADRQVWVIN
jgi:hypothetical protein